FDPVANVPWAIKIGRAWAKDALLTSFRADIVRKNGTADLAAETDEYDFSHGVWYTLVSPSRIASYHRNAVHREHKVNFELTIQVQNKRVRVLRRVDTPGDDLIPSSPLPPRICSIGAAVATLLRTRKIPERPVYSANFNPENHGQSYGFWVNTRDSHG